MYAEWGHATNTSAVVGRRVLSKGLFLDRRTFLQSYDPSHDPEGTILEGILTAVGPVIAGIGLEYYFSRVDNMRYGSGTKILHNVSGLVGVMTGAESDLRTGLPFQMVWVHEPMRLTFVVECLPAIISRILQRHRALQKLFDNMWLHLIVLDILYRTVCSLRAAGTMVVRFDGSACSRHLEVCSSNTIKLTPPYPLDC